MKLFWKLKEANTWQLCCHPAALLMTLKLHDDGWRVTCLGEYQKLAGPDVELDLVKKWAVTWLAGQIYILNKVLDNGIPS